MGTYRPASVCLNGHLITSMADRMPASAFCPHCGEATTTQCPNCSSMIRGYYDVPGVFSAGPYEPAAYCYSCGEPYPWTERKLAGVAELAAAIDELTDYERAQLAELLPHLVQETPRTIAAGFKVSSILSRLKGPAKKVLTESITSVIVEAGKAAMGL
jgi:hypothetical protein